MRRFASRARDRARLTWRVMCNGLPGIELHYDRKPHRTDPRMVTIITWFEYEGVVHSRIDGREYTAMNGKFSIYQDFERPEAEVVLGDLVNALLDDDRLHDLRLPELLAGSPDVVSELRRVRDLLGDYHPILDWVIAVAESSVYPGST